MNGISMFISTRKVEYDGRQEYLYDVIVKDPSWVYEKMYNSLTPIEKTFYDAITSRRPSSDIEIDVSHFMDIFSPYKEEPVLSEPRIQKLLNGFEMAINEYNKDIKNWNKHYSPGFNYGHFAGEPIAPDISGMSSLIDDIKTKFQSIRAAYKKGKITQDVFDSEERMRLILPDLEAKIREKAIEYGSKMEPYFIKMDRWMEAVREAKWTYERFKEECHYRGTMEFGKYSGKTIRSIIKHDIGYIEWALHNKDGFVLKGDDLQDFIAKTGYDPTETHPETGYIPSDGLLKDISSFLGEEYCRLESVVFETSKLPETRNFLLLNEKYPEIKYSITSNGKNFLIRLFGGFNYIRHIVSEPQTKSDTDDNLFDDIEQTNDVVSF